MNRELLEILACPNCRSADLEASREDAIVCHACGTTYPINNGVPSMLPPHLARTLPHKGDYTDRLMQAMRQGRDLCDAGDPEADRFMWEHHLYNWGKRVIYSDLRAGKIFSSDATDGARKTCRFITEWCGEIAGKRLLYIGSGNDSLVALPLQHEGAFIVNLDVVSDSMQDLMAAGARHCVCGDARCLPFRDAAFDVVFTKGSLHHSQPIDTPLKEIARVARRGGHIIAAEPNRYACLSRFPMPGGLGHPTPYEHTISSRQVQRILSSQGICDFRIAAFTYAHPATPPPIARTWQAMGRVAPWLFDRFAFEFILHGRKA
jgi:uncharacterized protein YbaR (Trm112 family)/ubiquinone/menaquinone biosynthesis C-methylase UbiE